MRRVRFGLHICCDHNGLFGTFIHSCLPLFTFLHISNISCDHSGLVVTFIHFFIFVYISHISKHFTHFCRDRNWGVAAGRGHGNKCLGFSTATPPTVIQFTTINSIGNPLNIFKQMFLSFEEKKKLTLLNEKNTLQCSKCNQLLLIMPGRSERVLWAYFIQHESSPRAPLCRKGWQGWPPRQGIIYGHH